MKIIVNDSASFYFRREAEIIQTVEIDGAKYHHVAIGNVTFAISEKNTEFAK